MLFNHEQRVWRWFSLVHATGEIVGIYNVSFKYGLITRAGCLQDAWGSCISQPAVSC